jgi:polysaccharide export outer membrane protein
MKRIFASLVILTALFSCTPVDKLIYTANTEDSRDKFFNDRSEKTIQPYDYLYIKIYSLDETTSEIFNADTRYGQYNEQLISYEVSDKGFINFPFIGNILLKDLTIEQAREKLERELNKYLTNISIRVRFVGNKITVLGEVRYPGNYTFFDEKITIFQALGLAGDIFTYGDKTKVTLLRETDNIIQYHYLDLTNKNIAESEYYYMLPNDILIVDAVPARYRQLQDRNLIYLILTTLTSIATVAMAVVTISNTN